MPLGRTQAFALDFLLKGSGEKTPAWDVLLRGERWVLESSQPVCLMLIGEMMPGQ
jgi:hypothetical protein